jgi:hypothetical protein
MGSMQILVLDDSPTQKQELAQRLLRAGCQADMSGTKWLRAGDFAAAPRPGPRLPDPGMDSILVKISNSYSNSLPLEGLVRTLNLPPAQVKADLAALLKLGYVGQRSDEFDNIFYSVRPLGTDYMIKKGLL